MGTLKCKLSNLLEATYLCQNKEFEESNSQVKMRVPIQAENVQFSLYSFDVKTKKKDSGLFPFFKKEEGNNRMCDYIIFSEYQGRCYVLLVELKKGKTSVMEQLAAGECFVKFLIDTLNRISKTNINPIIRKIAIRGLYVKSKPTTKVSDVKYDENGLCTFKGSTFYLREFLK